jgi:acyl-CoA synthetase (AMP-forming)/AMP-acid ligase II
LRQYNIAQPLAENAARVPFRPAIVFPAGRDKKGRAKSTQFTFQQLNQECDRYAHGLYTFGVRKGARTLMMVRPGPEFIALVFALFKIGAVPVMIDPGMGRKAFLQCVAETEPVNFIGLTVAHVLRTLFPKAFKTVERSVTVGETWANRLMAWDSTPLERIQSEGDDPFPCAATTTEDEAAVAFTSGSTGIPKGVVFLHGSFQAQIDLLRKEIGIADGDVHLPGLYIFALFNPALGATTIIPDMDPSKTAQLNPAFLVEAIQTHGVTVSSGSPTVWTIVAHYCREHGIKLPSLKRIFMVGAPVHPSLIRAYAGGTNDDILPYGDVYTPFGSTEALPITMMSGQEILRETATLSEQGKGMCVGRPTTGNTIRIITITDDVIPEWDKSLVLPDGEVGEIVVKGPVVTRTYLNRPQQTAEAKIREGGTDHAEIWHRMGDLGYFDHSGRLWFCGRKKHRIETAQGLLLPVPNEAIFNLHPDVSRTALVGVGERGKQEPVLVVEPKPGRMPTTAEAKHKLIAELLTLGAQHAQTRSIQTVLFHPSFPVDVRHNAKIQREKLAPWAEKTLKK